MNANAEKSMTSLDIILGRFPNREEKIQALYKSSPTFREICADYQEMVNWLEDNPPLDEKSSDMRHHASELLKELEDEIMDCLEGRHALVAKEHHNG